MKYQVILFIYFFVFFFQAEDGIRDIGVTGVQTCALPIYFNILCIRKILFTKELKLLLYTQSEPLETKVCPP